MNGQMLGFCPLNRKLESFISPKISLWESRVNLVNNAIFSQKDPSYNNAFSVKFPCEVIGTQSPGTLFGLKFYRSDPLKTENFVLVPFFWFLLLHRRRLPNEKVAQISNTVPLIVTLNRQLIEYQTLER